MNDELLRRLPSVDELLRSGALKDALALCSHAVIVEAAQETLSAIRAEISSNGRSEVSLQEIIALTQERINAVMRPSVKRVINATGAVLHTNMGRAVLSRSAADAAALVARNHTNLELDVETGERGLRDYHVDGLLKRLTGAEAACVVNNNAAAVFITLNTLAAGLNPLRGKEVIISRGELVEIGGSFRLHEIINKSGCVLKEVGAANRTHPHDYARAITPQTALLFKAHKSNFTVAGFTAEVGLKELVAIGRANGLPVVEDLGSGSLVDLSAYGLPKEPVVGERLLAGADIVTFSGDKLLGGPQAGLICGKKELIRRINENPLKRVLRADKLTIAALEATLILYLNKEKLSQTLPSLKYMTRTVDELDMAAQKAAALLKAALGDGFIVTVEDSESVVGGGSMPGHKLPTKVVAITHEEMPGVEPLRAARIYRMFLASDPPIVGRVNNGSFLLDMRTVDNPEDVVIRKN
ncbi:MAG: L-seryl-tRNA(Sec) selenium transferase [Deltaproteobacteria bacterium]|nr:L-seryl-tRNA(Sec) selenium transferase [Deltaproteobacteria bacterium]